MRTAKNGLVTLPNNVFTAANWFKCFTDEERVDIPKNKIPNPSTTSPIRFAIGFLINMTKITPAMIKNGAIASNLNEISCPVTVVPILAPMITPTDCDNFIIPLFTKLTTKTVVALEDWIIPVNIIPRRSPIIELFVNFSSTSLIFWPATFCKPSLIRFIPYKNKPTPAKIDNINSIVFLFSEFHHFLSSYTFTLI